MNCILPELVGKSYTRAQENVNVSAVANDTNANLMILHNVPQIKKMRKLCLLKRYSNIFFFASVFSKFNYKGAKRLE